MRNVNFGTRTSEHNHLIRMTSSSTISRNSSGSTSDLTISSSMRPCLLRLAVLLLMLPLAMTTWASATYYAKLTANVATGKGKVYVAANGSTGTFATTSNSTQSKSSTGNSANVSFQIGAQADNGYYFVNWTGNNKPSTATNNPGTVTISSNNSTSPGVTGTVSANTDGSRVGCEEKET